MAAKSDWDIVVVGSGSCGLTAASYLAAAGRRCLVLERQSYAGGGVASLHMTEPGYISERHSAIHQLVIANPLMTHDELGLLSKYGLNYIPLIPAYAIIFEDGVLPLYADRNKNIETLKQVAPEDVGGYTQFADAALGITKMMTSGMFEPPKDNVAEHMQSSFAEDIVFAMKSSTLDVIDK